MSNGIRVSTVECPEGRKFVVGIFLDDEDSDWVEFNREQFVGLIELLQTRLAEYDKPMEVSS